MLLSSKTCSTLVLLLTVLCQLLLKFGCSSCSLHYFQFCFLCFSLCGFCETCPFCSWVFLLTTSFHCSLWCSPLPSGLCALLAAVSVVSQMFTCAVFEFSDCGSFWCSYSPLLRAVALFPLNSNFITWL